MQIVKSYLNLNPELLYSELEDIIQRHGGSIVWDMTYKQTPPGGGLRGSIVASFAGGQKQDVGGKEGAAGSEGLQARLFGMAQGETKLVINIREDVLPVGKAMEMLADLDLVAAGYEKTV